MRHARLAPVGTPLLNLAVAVRAPRAAGPAVGPDRAPMANVRGAFFALGDQGRAADGRLLRRHEQTVVPPRQRARHGGGGEAADPVGTEPLAALGCVEVAAELAEIGRASCRERV